MAETKIGAEIDALLRQGAKDLHNAIVPAFPQSVRSNDEPGTPLNPTPQMVTDDLVKGYDEALTGYARQPQPENTPEMER